ncbi:aspartate--tRNA(Asn) ligase [Mangrovactinospora gilvigrisea]|uniref:Aspartate--tRNA(Asp/Asn) ligase n=1 Tax=Mangrovactinospora gilvigrisea TaxID=1428644 RepID=A0A1J7BFE2_9ACTN|nr:aspartate--tRNA(Asn) ligase [Mangrovactinospora gilvigrisea]OIV37293.1 aspartate--tRNA(Asn) ligase [Mangrovactinospora gilvigrisea]
MIQQTTTRVLASEVAEHAGGFVRLNGWLHRQRVLKHVTFLIVRDRSGTAQVVLKEPVALPEETPVAVTGTVSANPQAPGGAELVDAEVTALSGPAEAPPFELWRPTAPEAGLATILDNAPVALRHPHLRAPLEISAASAAGFRAALDGLGFTEVHTPKVTASATESGANVFGLDWFGKRAFLAQSPQFYKQAMVGVFERVYEVGPVFRAEPSDTARHLAQYTSLDAELGFVADHRDVMAVLREALVGMVASVRERAGEAVRRVGARLPEVPAEIPSVHFAEALEMLGRPATEIDLAPADERELGAWALREHGSEFLFVTGYPMAKRPFYTHPDPARPAHSNSFDLLFRGLELVTGGQRLHRYEEYLAALAARGEPVEPYAGYLRAFAHGMPPHGGFALGLERWTARVVGAENVRSAVAFPRDLHRLTP